MTTVAPGPPDAATPDDRISLRVPAAPEYGRVARAAVSSLALRLGVPFRRVEDIRLAVDEAFILLLQLDPDATDLVVDIGVGARALTVDMHLTPPRAGPADARLAAAAGEAAAGEAAGGEVGPEGGGDDAAPLRRFEALMGGLVDEVDAAFSQGRIHLAVSR